MSVRASLDRPPGRLPIAGGLVRSSTSVAALVDTNVLVYRHDSRFPDKQARADALLREGIARDTIRIAHHAVVEFVAATTRPQRDGDPILDPAVARLEAEDLLRQFEVIYPDDRVVRSALQGMAAYGL